jgi:septal ring factor EnvC (AmiA/AmiB activator)
MQQILDHYSQVQEELNNIRRQVSEYEERLEEQSMRLEEQSIDKDLLEMDLDHHKDTVAKLLSELADKQYVVETQGFLLECAREEVQSLITASAEKDRAMSDLRAQIELSTVDDGRKKRRLAS